MEIWHHPWTRKKLFPMQKHRKPQICDFFRKSRTVPKNTKRGSRLQAHQTLAGNISKKLRAPLTRPGFATVKTFQN